MSHQSDFHSPFGGDIGCLPSASFAFLGDTFVVLVWETLICLNEFFLISVGAVKAQYSDLLDAGFRNSSFVFGVRPDFVWAAKLFDPLVPEFLRTDAFGINGGVPFYFPVLWLVVPAFVYLIPVYVFLSSPFWISKLVKKSRKTVC